MVLVCAIFHPVGLDFILEKDMEYEIHEAAEAFPMLPKKELAELANDIKENGLQVPIVLYAGKILDGRNRYKACQIAGVQPRFNSAAISDPYLWVWSLNGERRHLQSQEQKAIIWSKLHGMSADMIAAREKIKREADKARSGAAKQRPREKSETGREVFSSSGTVCTTTSKPKAHKIRESEAKSAGVNKGAMASATVLLYKSPVLAEKVARGEIRYSDASREVKKQDFAKRVEEHKKAEPKESVLEKVSAEVVVADPPWRYDFSETKTRDIENNYPTATVEEICKHVPKTEKDCVLLLWATAPKLLEAIDVMDAWGFKYKTQAVWDKQKIGMGYWFRGQHEILLVGTKGNPCPPDVSVRVSSVFSEERTKHSKKPVCVYEWIERAFFDKVKVEMYCRIPRKGWHVWGNEV